MGRKNPDPNDQETDGATDPKEYTPTQRLELLESIVGAILGAHGETYPGAGEHREQLERVISAHHG